MAVERLEVLVERNRFAAGRGGQRLEYLAVDRVPDEPDGTIDHQDIDPAFVIAVERATLANVGGLSGIDAPEVARASGDPWPQPGRGGRQRHRVAHAVDDLRV